MRGLQAARLVTGYAAAEGGGRLDADGGRAWAAAVGVYAGGMPGALRGRCAGANGVAILWRAMRPVRVGKAGQPLTPRCWGWCDFEGQVGELRLTARRGRSRGHMAQTGLCCAGGRNGGWGVEVT